MQWILIKNQQKLRPVVKNLCKGWLKFLIWKEKSRFRHLLKKFAFSIKILKFFADIFYSHFLFQKIWKIRSVWFCIVIMFACMSKKFVFQVKKRPVYRRGLQNKVVIRLWKIVRRLSKAGNDTRSKKQTNQKNVNDYVSYYMYSWWCTKKILKKFS